MTAPVSTAVTTPVTAPALRTISALGVIEIFAWGSSFYLMAPLAGAIGAETGWSLGFLSGGVSLGLLVSGLSAPAVGRWIGRTGGRLTLSTGMVCLALGLALLGLAQSQAAFLLAWAVLGLGMACGLYDAAFSVLGSAYGRNARAAITQLTLWGGFASTVCWPLSAWMVEAIGWRGACFAYAALHLCLTLPLSRLLLPRTAGTPEAAQRAGTEGTAAPAQVSGRDLRVLCIVATGVTLSMLASIFSIHMVPLLGAQGYTMAAAIGLGTLLGPSQVAARVLEMLGRGRHHPIWTLSASAGCVLIGMGGLALGVPAAVAVVAWGAGNGLWSICRGALPLAIFGAEGYAALMGRLARPMLIAGAVAPLIGAALIEGLGPERTLQALGLLALLPLCATALLFSRLEGAARRLPT